MGQSYFLLNGQRHPPRTVTEVEWRHTWTIGRPNNRTGVVLGRVLETAFSGRISNTVSFRFFIGRFTV